ncbi:MAG: ATP synthase subunit I, partial [Rubrivivax sp.]
MNDTKARAEHEEEATEGFGPDFKPLSAEEAQRWRARQAPLSVWRVVGGQALVGVLVTLVAWLWGGSAALASSAA